MKRLVFILAVIFSSSSSFAQEGLSSQLEVDGRKVRVGFLLDPMISWLGPKESFVKKDGSKFGFRYGFMVDFIIDPNYAIASGVQITHAGGNLKYPTDKGIFENGNSPNENSYKINLQYVEIPVALKLKTNPIGDLTYWGQFGTYLGINIGARFSGTADGVDFNKEKITSEVTPINAGLLIGAGVEYPLNDRTTLSVGLGFQNGFVDVTRNKKWDGTSGASDGKVILNNLGLKLGVYF